MFAPRGLPADRRPEDVAGYLRGDLRGARDIVNYKERRGGGGGRRLKSVDQFDNEADS